MLRKVDRSLAFVQPRAPSEFTQKLMIVFVETAEMFPKDLPSRRSRRCWWGCHGKVGFELKGRAGDQVARRGRKLQLAGRGRVHRVIEVALVQL